MQVGAAATRLADEEGGSPRGPRRAMGRVERRLHPGSRAVVGALADEVVGQLYWLGRDLDASAEPDDVVQTLALAQLEAEAAGARPGEGTLPRETQRRARRALWPVRGTRGRRRRATADDARVQLATGPDGGLAAAEELGWDDVVGILGWTDGLALWLWAVEEWTLSEVGEWQALTKQRAWHRVHRAATGLRARLSSRRARA